MKILKCKATLITGMDGTPYGQPAIFDYQIKGFMKEAAKALARISGSDISKTKAYVKIINELMFIYNHDGGRKIPMGATFEFELHLLEPKYEIMEIVLYGLVM